MREALRFDEMKLNRRPIGRFLLSLDQYADVETGHEQALDYARHFAAENAGLIHKKNVSFIAKAQMDADSGMSVDERMTPKFEDTIWLELDSRNAGQQKDSYIWRISGGDEQYDLELRQDYWIATYYEKDSQNAILRRYPIDDERQVAGLQQLVEQITGSSGFVQQRDGMVHKIEADKREMHELEEYAESSPKKIKRIAALRSALFNAGFPAGSVDRMRYKPLF